MAEVTDGDREKAACNIEDCDKPVRARGWCSTHHQRWRMHGDPSVKITRRTAVGCEAPGCERPNPVGRFCNMHKLRMWRNGELDRPAPVDRRPHSQGYVLVRDEAHPLAVGEWVYEHRAVLFAEIGPGSHDCHWCSETVTWERSYPQHADALVVDHLDEDKAHNDPSNLVPSCARCNFARSSRWKKRQETA